jgi:hypothetical protein
MTIPVGFFRSVSARLLVVNHAFAFADCALRLDLMRAEVHEAFDLVRQYIGPTKGGDRSQKGRFSHPKGTEDATREEGE